MNSLNLGGFLVVFIVGLWCSNAERDFNFNDDIQQITLTEPPEEFNKKLLYKSPYSKEMSQCSSTESKLLLSLVLKSNDWTDLIEKKRNRAFNKLSKFFGIPREYMHLASVSQREIFDMTKGSIKRGPNKCGTGRRLGKIEFMIGCGQTLFATGEPISNQIGHQMKDGSIDDIAGVNFGWWVIWRKKVSNRVQRYRRQASEGSGDDDYDDYDYEEGGEGGDGDESATEVPTVTTHAHRHHHGISDLAEGEEDADDEDAVEEITVLPKEDETESSTTTTTTVQIPLSTTAASTTTTTVTTTSTTTTPKPTTTSTIATTEYIEPEPVNTPPIIKNRLPKQPVTAGKPFSLQVPLETFHDDEDGNNLRLQLFDKNGNEIKPNSWIQFNSETREIYGLPLEDAVSRWQYKLAATDSGNETVTETFDISVQQHKGHRSVNHEISIGVKLNEKFIRNIDWQIRLIRGIVETLNDDSLSNVVVQEVRQSQQDPYFATFIYTNESLPKDSCPEEQLNDLVKRLDPKKLTESLLPELSVKTVSGQPVGPCQKLHVPKPKPTPHATKNYPPVPRNQVDRVNASVGHLLVYKVPQDTFYDPEDTTDLKLSLLTMERTELGPRHWLQFDSKNQEFYGIPKGAGSEEYLLVAEDHGGLTASDALVVVVNHSLKRDYSVYFKVYLGIKHELFNAYMQRKFVERIAMLFGDPTTQHIQIRSITTHHDSDGTIVNFFNTTLYKSRDRCPEEEIEAARNVLFHKDSILRDRVKKVIGKEFDLTNVQLVPLGSCHSIGMDTTHREFIPIKTEETNSSSSFTDDYLFTIILPAVIIVVMILLASIIACVLHRRRLTGKMELGDEEERKSFRSRAGIPVIFQDELDEKPEIGNKSPIILKDEKPPLLPPSYNSTNLDGDNDVDEYVPPPAVVMGGREMRGKSPVTPSYRKPPPYVSP